MKNFGAWIVRERAKYGLTQQQLADTIDVGLSSLSSWESGTTNPRAANRAKVEQFFELAARRVAMAVETATTRKLPSNPKASLNLVRLKDLTAENVGILALSAPRYGATEFTRLVENTVGAIHQIPGFFYRSTRKEYELKQIEAYFGRSSGSANGEANLHQRFRAGIERGHTHGFVFAVASIKHSLGYERHGITLLDALRETDGLCISNKSLRAVGRVGTHEPGYLYVTFKLLPTSPELARELTRAEILEICRRMRNELGANAEGFKRGLETANRTDYGGNQPLKETHFDVRPE